MKKQITKWAYAIKARFFNQEVPNECAATNEFINGVEPSKKPIEPAFKPTDKKVMKNTINRDASEFTTRKPPKFEDDLRKAHTPNIAFMHSLVKPDFKKFI